MSTRGYVFGEDADLEGERLVRLEEVFDAQSQHALLELGLTAGWQCWEVGAGRGSIARWLSGVVGPAGGVLATDLDDQWIGPSATDLVFRRHDVVLDPLPEERFDLVHARFVLEHLADPSGALARLVSALKPGGVLVLEDSTSLELTIAPSRSSLEHFVSAWERAGRATGWNATYGSELMSDLRLVGLRQLGGRQCRRLAPGGDQWAHLSLGIDRLRDELLQQGVTSDQVTQVIELLGDQANLIAGPPVTIAWGQRGAT